MKKNSRYVVQFRRKREGTTNYRKRLKILASNKPRLIVRKSLKNMQAAIAEYDEKGDIVKVSSHSSNLKKFGWGYNSGNLPAAYLVGYLLGKRAGKKFEDVIFDRNRVPNSKVPFGKDYFKALDRQIVELQTVLRYYSGWV